MKRYTRKHYNKKLVALGLSAFMGIGLTSTGFAAWVMSKDAELTPEGNVNVSIIQDASVEITLTDGSYEYANSVYTMKDNFYFDSKNDDFEGRIRATKNQLTSEDLQVTVSGRVVGAEVVYDLTAKVELPATISNAITAGYLAWDTIDYSATPVEITIDDAGNFSFIINNFIITNKTRLAQKQNGFFIILRLFSFCNLRVGTFRIYPKGCICRR